jgi:predicted acetyltransferase
VSWEVRPCAADELAAGLSPIWHFFGSGPDDEALERMRGVLEPGRLHAAWEDGQAVGGAAAYSFQLTVPGGRVPAAGVAAVGVFPTHRRRGVLRAMMRAQLDDVRARGEPVAYLWASEPMIYGRFGYGVASVAGEIHIPRTRAGFAEPFEPRGRVRLVSVDEALELIPPVYESVARETPGMFARPRGWWETRALADPERRRRGGGEMVRAVLEVDGRVEAYGLYRLHTSFEAGSSTGYTSVIEAMAVSPEATREIWRYLFDVDWMESVKAYLLPPDHPLWLLLADPRRMLYRSGDGAWLRLVDVGAALAARSYEDGEPVVFEVRDAFCPWNEGRYRVGGGGAERTGVEPDLRLDVSALSSAYLGGFTFGQLARALRLEEARPGGVARADALFRTDRAPWCPEIF